MTLFPTVYFAFENESRKKDPILREGYAKFLSERHFRLWAKSVMLTNQHVTLCVFSLSDDPNILKFISSTLTRH